jgi:hypothetical protein
MTTTTRKQRSCSVIWVTALSQRQGYDDDKDGDDDDDDKKMTTTKDASSQSRNGEDVAKRRVET